MSNLMAAQYVSNLFCSAVMVFHVDTDFLSVKVIVLNGFSDVVQHKYNYFSLVPLDGVLRLYSAPELNWRFLCLKFSSV